jgi:hypothetical protein
MATTLNLYDLWRDHVADPTRAAAVSGTLKCMLVTSAYTPNQNTDEFVTTPIASEVTGTGYTARGNACASPSWTGPSGGGLLTFDASDPAAWAQNAAGFTNARRAIFYYDTGTNGTSRLVAYTNDYGADLSSVPADVEVQINVAGIYTSPR